MQPLPLRVEADGSKRLVELTEGTSTTVRVTEECEVVIRLRLPAYHEVYVEYLGESRDRAEILALSKRNQRLTRVIREVDTHFVLPPWLLEEVTELLYDDVEEDDECDDFA